MQNKAFTLAEILITLGIVGFIASITIPNLIDKSQQNAREVAFKKMYANTEQAIRRVAGENGNTLKRAFGYTDTAGLRNLIMAQYKILEKCDLADCVPNDCPGYKYMTVGTCSSSLGNTYGFILADGSSVTFTGAHYDCDADVGDGKGPIYCSFIIFDIDGPKNGINTWGKDVYRVSLTENRIIPWIYQPTGFNDCSRYGFGCAAALLGYQPQG